MRGADLSVKTHVSLIALHPRFPTPRTDDLRSTVAVEYTK